MMLHRVRAWSIAVVLAGLASCGDGGPAGLAGKHSQGSAVIGGQVISTVHGFAITVADVQSLVDASELTPLEALRRLQAEQLLMGAAEERGVAGHSEVKLVQRKAAVQALLDQLASSATVSDAEIRAAYDKAGTRFGHPELRAAVHVLARLPKNPSPEADAAAKAFAKQVIPRLGQAADPVEFVKTLAGQKQPEFVVVGEALPPVPQGKAFEEPFMTALFAAKGLGVYPEPVRTSYGWHALRLVKSVPAEWMPIDQAAKQLRPELLLARRTKMVDELIETVLKEQGAKRPSNVTELLATLPP